jgi:uncharacterized membrane protein YdjX (TVP38/TMEM64 family)
MSSESTSPNSSKRWLVWAALIVGVFVTFQFLPIDEWLNALDIWIKFLGYWGPLAFLVIYILATIFLFPGAAMTPLSGLLFSLGWGTLWAVIASSIGANLAFLIGRYFARDALAEMIEGNEKFVAIDKAVGSEGWKIVCLTRLSPVFPSVLLNYACGLTSVKWVHFALASIVGMLPRTVMYVYFGSLGDLLKKSDSASTLQIVYNIVIGVVTIFITLWVSRWAKKALNEKADFDE